METRSEVIVISAFGRGQWLAQRLVAQGRRVMLIDVTACMGLYTPEEWEGPFPIFSSKRLDDSQFQFLTSQGLCKEVPAGFTVWLKDGPAELRGPLAGFSLDRLGLASEAIEYVRDFESLDEAKRQTLEGFLQRQTFDRTWLAHLAHQLSSNAFHSSFNSLGRSFGSPLFNRVYLRQFTAHDLKRSLQRSEEMGVRVYEATQVSDLSMQGSNLDGIEIIGRRSGVLTAKRFVWFLTAAESQRLAPRVVERLFQKERAEAQWCWVRYRYKLDAGVERDVLPSWFVMVEDLHFPWTHGNLAIVRRSLLEPEFFDTWVLIPARRRFHQSFLEEIGSTLTASWQRRVKVLNPALAEYPLEYKNGFETLGAARFPVYDPQALESKPHSGLRNVVFDGPQYQRGLDRLSQLTREGLILDQLLKEMLSEDENIRKERAGDQPLHSP